MVNGDGGRGLGSLCGGARTRGIDGGRVLGNNRAARTNDGEISSSADEPCLTAIEGDLSQWCRIGVDVLPFQNTFEDRDIQYWALHKILA